MSGSFAFAKPVAAKLTTPLKNILFAIAFLVWILPAHADAQSGAPVLDYCFTPYNGSQKCYPSLEEAEAKMRESTAVGEYLVRVDEHATSSKEWRWVTYRAEQKRPPESQGLPGYMIGGWSSTDLGCTPAPPGGPGTEYCASESQAISLWIARRAAFLAGSNCEYRNNSVVGVHSPPSGLAGAYSASRYGAAVFGHGPSQGGRYIDEEWWCPGWGSPDSVKSPTQISKVLPFTCPAGFVTVNPPEEWPIVCAPTDGMREIVIRNRQPETCKASSHPCYPATGEKQRHETDFEFAGEPFTRSYRSAGVFQQGNVGSNWSHSLGSTLTGTNSNDPHLINDDGSYLPLEWASQAGGIATFYARGVSDRIVRQIGGNYEWLDDAGNTRVYDVASGRLLSRRHASDPTRDLAYTYDTEGFLREVIDGAGRKLSFHYSSIEISRSIGGTNVTIGRSRLLTEIVLPDGSVFEYAYDGHGNLVAVLRPDGTSREYHYNESNHVGAPSRHLMTGITDNGVRYATFTYDAYGRVTSSTLAGGVERTELAYVSANEVDVTTPNGLVRRYTYAAGLQRRLLSISDSFGTVQNLYDGQGRRIESRDRAGRRTLYTYTNGHVATVTQAAGTNLERVTSYSRDAVGRVTGSLVSAKTAGVLQPVMRSATAYSSDGRVVATCSIDPGSASASYVCGSAADAPLGVVQSSFRYCTIAEAAAPGSSCALPGLLRAVDGPRPGTGDRVLNDYRPSDDTTGCATQGNCHRKGDLWKITDGLGRVVEIERYDLAGRVVQLRDMNQVVSRLTYDARGRVATRTVMGPNAGSSADDVTSTITYESAGLVRQVTQPDGAFIRFSYDAAHRMNRVEDNFGNRIDYALDEASNRYTEETRDSGGVLKRTMARLFDDLGRVVIVADASANATEFTYDLAGNLDTATDALGRTTDNAYDALGRLRESIANVGGTGAQRAQSQFEYDALDRLTSVIDPKGLATQYEYDAFGNLLALFSPDTGTATYAYDVVGNRTSALDSRGIASNYSYDAVGRLTAIDLPSAGADIAFTFDTVPTACVAEETFGVGRLGTFSDSSGSTKYCYDRRGNVVRKVQANTGGPTRTLRYAYTAADRVSSVTYPSGLVLTYTRDAAGQITGVTAKNSTSEAPVALVTSVAYQPFGPMRRIVFANGRVLDKNYDLDYGIASVSDSAADGMSIGYSLDDVGNVIGVAERQTSGAVAARSVDYDGLNRLTGLRNGATVVQGFGYDATGNRTSKTTTAVSAYQYGAASHRLTKVGTGNRTYDAAGNMLTMPSRTFTYDDRGRLSQFYSGGTLSREYRYNALGQRVVKIQTSNAANNIHFVYDEAGKLMGEYKPDGTLIREYLWMDDTLVAMRAGYAGQKFQYVLTDHLNTPRAVVLPSANKIIWRWDITPTAFGEHTAVADPDADGTNYQFNLRYPGQYFDGETGLHYNYFRDFEPGTGRYIESDPIGLEGGMSTFAYVRGNPLGRLDPNGLWDFETGDYSLPQGLVDFAAGTGDTLSFNLTSGVRALAGIDGGVNKCSAAYSNGEIAGVGVSMTFGGLHLGRNALLQSTRGGFGTGMRRLFSDPRGWRQVRGEWSVAAGGGVPYLKTAGQSLHHWLIPQRLAKVNASYNYLPLSAGFNSWMNGSSVARSATEAALKLQIMGIYGAPVTAVSTSEECDCQ